MNPLVITCAITGAETSKKNQPHLPITPKEQAQAAAEAIKAGASVIHLHVREDDGQPSQRKERFEEAIHLIKKESPEAIIQISTGGAVGESIAKRMEPLDLKPEMASLNMGSLNFGEDVFINTPKDILAFAEKMKNLGVIPELEVYEAGMVEWSLGLIKKGILDKNLHFQFVMGVPGGMSGSIQNLVHLVSLLPQGMEWGVAGVGRFQLPLAVHSILMGGHVRVGFEDNIYYKKGELAVSNAQLVSRVCRIASECQRTVATPLEARQILGISR